jgi:hypothetical protein
VTAETVEMMFSSSCRAVTTETVASLTMWPAGVLKHRPPWKAPIVFFEVSCNDRGDRGENESVFLKTTRAMQTLGDEVALILQCLREQPENHPVLMAVRLSEIENALYPESQQTNCNSLLEPHCPDTQLDIADTVLDSISVADSESADPADSAELKGGQPIHICLRFRSGLFSGPLESCCARVNIAFLLLATPC